MKKIISNILFAALVVATAASCQKEELGIESQAETGGSRVLVASFDQDITRTTLGDDHLTPKWAAGDVIKLTDGTNSQNFTLATSVTDEANQAQITNGGARFTVTIPGSWGTTIYGCYPASAFDAISEEAVAINIPSSQDGSFAAANICTAKTTDNTLSFQNATALVKFTTEDATKAINIAISGASSITLIPSSAGVNYVAIPTGKPFKNFTFTAIRTATNWAAKTSTSESETVINKIYNLGAVADWTYNIDGNTLWGTFSVKNTEKVRFSKGNLRAKKGGDNWTWGFYDNQYECNSLNGSSSSRTAKSEDTEIDLFCWGYNDNNSVVPTTSSYESSFSDWGPQVGSGWSTLSSSEWEYLITTRGTGVTYRKYGVTVCGKANCLVIAPDGNTTAIASSYDASAWAAAEASGFVCLPAAGYRNGSDVGNVGDYGGYWSSSPKESDASGSYLLYFINSSVAPSNSGYRNYGHSVRLVVSSTDTPAS